MSNSISGMPASKGLRFALAVLFVAFLQAEAGAQIVKAIRSFGLDAWGPTPLIVGPDGSFYGMTTTGGDLDCFSPLGCGMVFQFSTASGGTLSTLYNFESEFSVATQEVLALDSSGSLYGTSDGIFRLTAGSAGELWNFHVIDSFSGQPYATPLSPLLIDESDAIYGTSAGGGLSGEGCSSVGCGAIFQLLPPTHNQGPWRQTVLYEFPGGTSGGDPSSLTMSSAGVIYGTTFFGGTFDEDCPIQERYGGCGVVFQLVPVNGTWKYGVLYSFADPTHAPCCLVMDATGNLYGLVGIGVNNGADAIFELSPPPNGSGTWTLSYLHRFEGWRPNYLTIGQNGTLYGMIFGDQDDNGGYVFQVAPPAQNGGTWTYNTLVDMNKAPYIGQNPSGLVVGPDGNLYVSLTGGNAATGNIIEVVLRNQ